MDDVRYAFRQLRTHPAFAAVAVATLAVGIGSAAAMFGLIQGVLLSPPPYADPDRLVLVSPARVDGQPYDARGDGRPVAGVAARAINRAPAISLDLQFPRPRRRQPVARRHGRHAATTSTSSASGQSMGRAFTAAEASRRRPKVPADGDPARLRPLAARVRRRSRTSSAGQSRLSRDAGAAARRRRDAAGASLPARSGRRGRAQLRPQRQGGLLVRAWPPTRPPSSVAPATPSRG